MEDSKSTKKLSRRKHQNSKIGCSTCKKRRVKCSEGLPACLNCIKHKVRCDYLDLSEEELQVIKLAKIRKENELKEIKEKEEREKQESIPKETSKNTITQSDTIKYSKLPNGVEDQTVFKIHHDQSVFQYKSPYLDNLEDYGDPKKLIHVSFDNIIVIEYTIRYWYNYLATSINDILKFNSLICFSLNYMRANAVKNFGFSNNDENVDKTKIEIINKLRSNFLPKSMSYYGKTLSSLTDFLQSTTTSNQRALSSITATWILSFVSFYKETNLSFYLKFTLGMVGIIQDILAKTPPQAAIDPNVQMFAEGMIHFSKTIYFPNYNPEFLFEFLDNLKEFGKLLYDSSTINIKIKYNNDKFKMGFNHESLIYHYNQLIKYVSDLIRILRFYNNAKHNNGYQNSPKVTSLPPKLMYELFRRWYCIVPPSVYCIYEQTHPFAKVLYAFYEGMGRALFALLPEVRYLFMIEFSGPVFMCKIDYNTIFENLDYNGTLNSKAVNIVKKNLTYSLRILNFFQKRSNLLYKFIFLIDPFPENGALKSRKLKDVNEIMITRFNSTIIKPINYPHASSPAQQHVMTATSVQNHNNLQSFNNDLQFLQNLNQTKFMGLQTHELKGISETEELQDNFLQITNLSNRISGKDFLDLNPQNGLLVKDFDPDLSMITTELSNSIQEELVGRPDTMELYYRDRLFILNCEGGFSGDIEDEDWLGDNDYIKDGF